MSLTPIADMVERMLADSAPATAIVAAIRALECVTMHHAPVTPPSRDASRSVTPPSRDASRSVTQEQSRRRSQNYRNRKKLQSVAKANDVAAESITVTPETVTRHVTVPNSAILTSLLSSSGKPLKEARSRENARARGTRLAPGAPLSDEHRAIIIAEGVVNPESFWAEFVDYWSDIPGQRGCKISWSGTLRNRCRMVKTSFNGAKNGRRTVHDAARELHEQTVAAVLAFDEPAPRSLRDGTGENAIRLLPPRGRQ